MARVAFTPHLQRFLDAPPRTVTAATVAAALEQVFAENPRLRGYVLDEHGVVRQHVTVFVGDTPVRNRQRFRWNSLCSNADYDEDFSGRSVWTTSDRA
ncbi:MAG TPA: hypothetical protein VNJ02_12880 [Vicinamibacterales bacterium]|nr:hypothetical protein [Vicinamibacterales bacterium]